MKRGLVVLDPTEISDAERRQRVDGLQRELRAAGLDGALIYGDAHRSDDIAFLTNFCVYWNEGVLFVPAEGEPTFVTKLSARTHPWMRSISTVEDIRSGSDLATLAAQVLTAAGARAVAMVDATWWPHSLAERLSKAASSCELRPADGLVRDHRLVPSGSDLALLRRAGAILDAAFATNGTREAAIECAQMVADAESVVRRAGALDLFASCDRTSDGVVSLGLTCQYRHVWAEMSRIVWPAAGETPGWVQVAERGYRAAAAALAPRASEETLHAAAAAHMGDLPSGATWRVRCTPHTDIGTQGGYIRERDAAMPGAVVALAAEVRHPKGGWIAVADTYEVNDGKTKRLTIAAGHEQRRSNRRAQTPQG